jgi:hypothetical protein
LGCEGEPGLRGPRQKLMSRFCGQSIFARL